MDAIKFDKIIHVRDGSPEALADAIIEAVGAKEGEAINILTPQFERIEPRKIVFIPTGRKEFNMMQHLPEKELLEMGVGIWEKENGYVHYLYPGEWYESIPEGYGVLTISGKVKEFHKATSDNDIRFGCLPYGFKRAV